jgi:hypothetical protein
MGDKIKDHLVKTHTGEDDARRAAIDKNPCFASEMKEPDHKRLMMVTCGTIEFEKKNDRWATVWCSSVNLIVIDGCHFRPFQVPARSSSPTSLEPLRQLKHGII